MREKMGTAEATLNKNADVMSHMMVREQERLREI